MRSSTLFLLLAASLVAACGLTDPEPVERDLGVTYNHTFDFLWEEVQAVLGRAYELEELDREEGVIRTAWVEQLAPMNRWGRRHRLEVRLEGARGEGYRVVAVQETEVNEHDRNPLSSEDADWEPTGSKGAYADRFLIALARHLEPGRSWKEEMAR